MSISSNERKNLIFKIIAALVFPFLGCLLYCLIRGTNFFELYLPNSYNNDVLFYYKMVEGMVDGGINGYFGFNESHALYGGFAAWNPMIVLPWLAWGFLFGWGYMAPILCNIFLFSIALVVFVILVKPGWKSIVTSFVIFLIFPSLWIHLMNGLPETIIAANLIAFMALMIAYSEDKKKVYLWIAIVLAIYLTVVRPYLVVFLLYALICMIKRKKWWDYVSAGLICITTGFIYALTNHFFTAAYFEPLYDMSLIKALAKLNITDAFYILGSAVSNTVPGIFKFLLGTFSFGSTAGTQYLICILFIVFSIGWLIFTNKKDRKYTGPLASYAIAGGALLIAIIVLLGKPNEGGRHCYAFAILAVMLLSLTIESLWGKIVSGALVALLVVFICRGAMIPTDYDIPMPDNKLSEEIDYWKSVWESNDSTGYDNTIIWALSDTVEGQGVYVDYYGLYAVPSRMGINCCNYLYLMDNINNLKCRYIAVAPDSYFEEKLIEQGYSEMGRSGDLVIYWKG